ncbi:unnamed protein product, partial [Nesidiocoris tenuis]
MGIFSSQVSEESTEVKLLDFVKKTNNLEKILQDYECIGIYQTRTVFGGRTAAVRIDAWKTVNSCVLRPAGLLRNVKHVACYHEPGCSAVMRLPHHGFTNPVIR